MSPITRTGRLGKCRACMHDWAAQRRAARPPPEPVADKACLLCGARKPAAAFGRNVQSRDGLHGYCRPCEAKRSASKQQARAPSRQPPPAQLVCGGQCGQLKPYAAFCRERSSLFGVHGTCKQCQVEVRRLRAVRRAAAGGAVTACDAAGSGGLLAR